MGLRRCFGPGKGLCGSRCRPCAGDGAEPSGRTELPLFTLLHPDGCGLRPRCCPLSSAKRTGPGTRTHTCKQRECGSILLISLLSRTAGAANSPGKAVRTAPSASTPPRGSHGPRGLRDRPRGHRARGCGRSLRGAPRDLNPNRGAHLTPYRLQKRAGAARRRARCFVSPWERNADLPIAFFFFPFFRSFFFFFFFLPIICQTL